MLAVHWLELVRFSQVNVDLSTVFYIIGFCPHGPYIVSYAVFQETALNIAYSCHLITTRQQVVVINARTKVSALLIGVHTGTRAALDVI